MADGAIICLECSMVMDNHELGFDWHIFKFELKDGAPAALKGRFLQNI